MEKVTKIASKAARFAYHFLEILRQRCLHFGDPNGDASRPQADMIRLTDQLINF